MARVRPSGPRMSSADAVTFSRQLPGQRVSWPQSSSAPLRIYQRAASGARQPTFSICGAVARSTSGAIPARSQLASDGSSRRSTPRTWCCTNHSAFALLVERFARLLGAGRASRPTW